ncbi:DUF3318 domain-containing protein [Paraburkholderia saeva]|uniref:DUF3318 domain-containing protein n=1 Tax=Paraburkholderia saeva TaxID=2777537 RepID=UPI001DBA2141|nr:DUF3318 domain-containing protein [Paraburkholderia saeva]CAG4901957.1 hypothetical protein R52603_02912 [Paraburkholderia saeva]
MSQPHPDHTFRSKRASKHLAAPHLRALRKEILIVRADVERMELVQATVELRQAVTHFSWLKFFVPGFGGMRWGAPKGNAAGIAGLLKQYPLLSSLASLLLAKPLRATVAAGAKPAIKWGSVAFAAWEAYRIWQQVKQDNRDAKAGATSDA